MRTEMEMAWAAGLFDGEGFVGVVGKKRHRLVAAVSQVDREVLDRFYKAIGVGHIYGPYGRTTRARPYFVWRAAAQEDVVQMRDLLRPYLSGVKKRQFEQALATKELHRVGAHDRHVTAGRANAAVRWTRRTAGFALERILEYPDGRVVHMPLIHNSLQTSFNIAKAGLISGKDTGIVRYIEVGSGDPSWDANPPPPSPGTAQTALLAPISRVGPYTNADWGYLDGGGSPTGTPTYTVQITTVIAIGVGNGTLRECALWSGAAATSTVGTGLLTNVIRFVALAKPAGGSDYNLTLKLTIAFT